MPGQRILLLVGRTGAGKSTLAAHLARRHGAYLIEASTVVQRLLGEPPEGSVAVLPAGFDYAQVARVIVEDIRGCDRPLIVISGLRTLDEHCVLTAYAPHTELVHVIASRRLRFHRCRARRRHDAPALAGTFRRLDTNPEHSLLPAAARLARFVVRNQGSIADLEDAADAIIAETGPRPRPRAAGG